MIEDKRRCERCGHVSGRPYMMSRTSDKNVLTVAQIAWIICFVLAASLLISLASA